MILSFVRQTDKQNESEKWQEEWKDLQCTSGHYIKSQKSRISPWDSVPVMLHNTWTWQWWTNFVLNRSESSKMSIIILSWPANFKQTVWQSCSVGALFRCLASLNIFQMETWESFPSIASKQLSVHHFNRPKVSSCSSSRRNGILACSKYLGFNWQESTHAIDYWLNCSCDFMTRHVSLCVRTMGEVFTSLKLVCVCVRVWIICLMNRFIPAQDMEVPIVLKYSQSHWPINSHQR